MLLRMSLSGGILIIMIAAVRLFAVNRLPKKYFMMLWGVALLRLLVPAELPFRFGVTIPVEKAVADKMKLVALNRDFLQEAAIRQGGGTGRSRHWGRHHAGTALAVGGRDAGAVCSADRPVSARVPQDE